jgi:hypothetical protein
MGPQLRELVLIAERKSNLGILRNAARRGTARAGTSTQSGFWVPLKGRQRPPTGTRPPITGCRGYGPDPISEKKKENPEKKLSDFSVFSSLDCFDQTTETEDKYLIHICEKKDHYLSSHTNPKGFSHGESDSRC